MNTVRVKFTDVGREHRTWEADLPPIKDGTLGEWAYWHSRWSKNVRTTARLMSHNIDIEPSEENDNKSGTIAAGFRVIGRFEILEQEKETTDERTEDD